MIRFKLIKRLVLPFMLGGNAILFIWGPETFALCSSSDFGENPAVVALNYYVVNWTGSGNVVYAALTNSNFPSAKRTNQSIIMGGEGSSDTPPGSGRYSPIEISTPISNGANWHNFAEYIQTPLSGSMDDTAERIASSDFLYQCGGNDIFHYGLWYSVLPTDNSTTGTPFIGGLLFAFNMNGVNNVSISPVWIDSTSCGSDVGTCKDMLTAQITFPPSGHSGSSPAVPKNLFKSEGALPDIIGSWSQSLASGAASGEVPNSAAIPIASMLGESAQTKPSMGDSYNHASVELIRPYLGAQTLLIPDNFMFQNDFFGAVNILENSFANGNYSINSDSPTPNTLTGYGSQIASVIAIVCENVTGVNNNCPWLGGAPPSIPSA